ncbi:hypothetical protein [Streptomyces sp. NBC_01304]|uniref:hypothetical protein n=1 Tax=Streptomyces sp. NBC_01304 TaxID=2903818 RepID=UPI002E107490|nr:hypothetical protein OG430_02965 [Streptomyces sp. NBC_01304]
MIVIPDARTAALYEQWCSIGAGSEPAVAEPLVLDCVRRLAAEPGGETAHVWVAGLTQMVRYLAWRPEPGTALAAVDALLAAATELGERDCGHETHPYAEELDWPRGWYLIGERPDVARGPADLCPRNVAGIARVAADVIAPFSVPGIPAVVSEDDESDVRDLLDFLNDYPGVDPAPTIETNASAPLPGSNRAVLAGYVITQHVTTPYVYHRIRTRPVFDAMIEGLQEALAMLGGRDGDGFPCPHADGEHPGQEDLYYETEAEIACHVRTPGGRAHLVENVLDEGEGEMWVCPGYLRELAEDALAQLRPRYTELFGERDTNDLDAVYVRSDGRLDIDALTRVIVAAEDLDDSGTIGENAGLWAARRHATATDPHERLVLLHLAMWTASVLELSYAVGREVRALLRAVDSDPLDHDCAHGNGDDAHPEPDLRESWQREEMKPHLDHLHAPGEFAVPEGRFAAPAGAFPADVWACPRLLAAWAQAASEAMDEAYAEMDEEDGDDGSTFL